MSSAPRSHLKLTCATLLGLGLVVSPLVALPASANTAGTGVVINEAYLNGGSVGATYLNKFVELYNPTDATISLDGMSLQYRPATATANPTGTVALTGTISAKGYYLVQADSNAANGAALPTPDATFGASLAKGGGTLFLANQTGPLAAPTPGSLLNAPGVIDLLGYGTSNTFETTVAPIASVTTALGRTAGADADTNSSDFTVAAPTPTNKAGETAAPVVTPTETPAPVVTPTPTTPASPTAAIPISEIQGTTDVSPKVNQVVTTTGVVTASYPAGGFKGFYLQTAGTGGTVDLTTHTASDGIFVYTNTLTAPVTIGDYVSVTGTASDYSNLTQITVSSLGDVTALDKAGIVAPLPATVGLPATDAARESLEGMLVAPQGDFTVTNNYTTNRYGDIGLAAGKTPLVGPTVTARPGTAAYSAAVADNAARAVTLDDGATTDYTIGVNRDKPVPYLTTASPLRVGAATTFTKPVILDFRNKAWKFQPTTELVPSNAATVQPATFSNTRTAAPSDVGGDISLATFNVLNYFATTGESIKGCSYYTDRAGTPITVDSGCDARGAATQVSFERQQAKIVSAINALDAEVVSLLEIENSARFDQDRDFALKALVTALNADAGSKVWAYVPSPADLPAIEDVIRSGFIYKSDAVETVDESVIFDDAAFGNARQPLAQAFQLVGDTGSSFVAIANHFKSKGSGTGANADQGDGQGASNQSRVEQATALVTFADTIKTSTGIDRVLLTGDFNAYDQEDPIRVITDAGYLSQEAKTGEYTYAFGGSVGSLDHVFASPEANAAVTDVDVWNINSVESVALEYSRYNNNVTDFYAADAFRSSDHDPAIVGLKLATPTSVDINLLNINDFHGRIDANTVKFAGTVEQLRAEYGDAATLFLSDGDNIGASLFASASQQDKPTIDVLNALKLKTSAVGNHEFDQGFTDLTGRVADRANFDYLGANVYQLGTTTPAMKEYALLEVNGVTVGVIGAVTQETPSLVSPNGIASLTFGDPVDAVNRVAAQLSDGIAENGEADVLIAEYHEGAGAGTVEKATLEQELALTDSAFAKIVTKTSAEVDAIFTGHTHKLYAWDAQVPGAAAGVTRPVLQTGSYGEYIGQVVLNYDIATGDTTTVVNKNVKRLTATHSVTGTSAEVAAAQKAADAALDAKLIATYDRVAAVNGIVTAALAEAAVIGNQPVGSVTADVTRACIGGVAPCVENRSAPSAMGTLVANSLRESLSDPLKGGAEIGVVNPGGMRAELVYSPDGVVTYAEANAVLPFLNNLWTTSLTGAQFKTVLEQQWQRDALGNIPSRPYLQLGLSDNVNYTFDASRPEGDRVTGIWIDGSAIDPARSYRVGSFNFLLTGGDNFREFKNGTGTRDSGLVDRDAWISYLTANSPVTPSFAARQASVTGVPATAVNPGDSVTLTVSSLNLSSLGAPKNTELTLLWPGSTAVLGTASVDADGSSVVTFTVPLDAPADSVLELTAKESGTIVRVAIDVNAPIAPTDAPATVGDVDADLENVVTADADSYDAGDPITVTVGEKFAGQYVWVSLDGTSLGGWLRANAQGQVTTVVPADATAGLYRLLVQDAAGGVIGWTEIEVLAAAITPTTPPTTPTPGTSTTAGSGSGSSVGLAHTGVDLAPLVAGGTLMLLLGGLLLARRRRVGFGES